jgi:MarR family transcriptional regulator, transcriptional regulator for hemolysin
MDNFPPEDSFGLLVSDVGRLMRKEFDRRVKGIGLSRAQWSVIVQLSRFEGISQATLADLMDVEPISLVPLLDKLQKSGCIERRANPNDRRAYQLYLAENSEPLLEQLRAIADDFRSEMMAGLDDAAQQAAIESLLTVKANLTKKPVEELKRAAGHE